MIDLIAETRWSRQGARSVHVMKRGDRHHRVKGFGIDSDRDVLNRARARFQTLPIEWVHGDVLQTDLDAWLAPIGWDIPLDAIALASRIGLSFIRHYWKHSAPQCWPPPLTYGEMKALGARVLPGVRYQRHLLGRYSLIWRKA